MSLLLATPYVIQPSGIASGEAFGAPGVSAVVGPVAIASAEVIGTPNLNPFVEIGASYGINAAAGQDLTTSSATLDILSDDLLVAFCAWEGQTGYTPTLSGGGLTFNLQARYTQGTLSLGVFILERPGPASTVTFTFHLSGALATNREVVVRQFRSNIPAMRGGLYEHAENVGLGNDAQTTDTAQSNPGVDVAGIKYDPSGGTTSGTRQIAALSPDGTFAGPLGLDGFFKHFAAPPGSAKHANETLTNGRNWIAALLQFQSTDLGIHNAGAIPSRESFGVPSISVVIAPDNGESPGIALMDGENAGSSPWEFSALGGGGPSTFALDAAAAAHKGFGYRYQFVTSVSYPYGAKYFTAANNLFFRFYIRFPTTSSGNEKFVSLVNGGALFYVGVQSNNKWALTNGVGFAGGGLADLIPGKWYLVEINYVRNGTSQFWIDGTLVSSQASTPDLQVTEIDVGHIPTASVGFMDHVDFDDIKVDSVAIGPYISQGITSAEAFGVPTVIPIQQISPSAIPSAEAFGVPAVQATLSPTGVASAGALGVPSAQATLSPTGIASAEALGVPAAQAILSPTGIASAGALGAPGVSVTIDLTTPSLDLYEDFEDSTLATMSGWTVTPLGSPVIPSTDRAKAGAASGKMVGSTQDRVLVQKNTGNAPVTLGFWFWAPTQTLTAGNNILVVYDDTGTKYIQIATTYDSGTSAYKIRGLITGGTSDDVSITANHWYWITVEFAAGVDPAFSVYDENLSLLKSRSFTTFGQAGTSYFMYGQMATTAYTTYYDELAVLLDSSKYPLLPPTGGKGIASGEAFGVPTVLVPASITGAGGIASAEAFGTPAAQATLAPTGVASAGAIGTPAIQATLSPAGIASAGAFGIPSLQTTLAPTGIASAEAFGSPSLSASIGPTGIASAEAFGVPTIVISGVINLAPVGIASAEAIGVPALTVDISAVGLASSESFGAPTVGGILHAIAAAGGIASEEAFGPEPVVRAVIGPAGIASAEAVGVPGNESGKTDLQGVSVEMDPAGIASAETFGRPSISVNLTVTAGIPSASVFGAPGLTVNLSPVGVGSALAFGTASILARVSPSSIGTAETFGDLQRVQANINPSGVASAAAFGQPTVRPYVQISGAGGIASAASFGSPGVSVTLSPVGIGSVQALGRPGVSVNIRAVGIGSQAVVGWPHVSIVINIVTNYRPRGFLETSGISSVASRPDRLRPHGYSDSADTDLASRTTRRPKAGSSTSRPRIERVK
jgi:hypothetical protein